MSFRCIKAFMHAFSGRFSRTCLEGISFNFFVCFIFNVSLGSAPKRKNFDIQRNTRVASGGQFTLNYHTPSHNLLSTKVEEWTSNRKWYFITSGNFGSSNCFPFFSKVINCSLYLPPKNVTQVGKRIYIYLLHRHSLCFCKTQYVVPCAQRHKLCNLCRLCRESQLVHVISHFFLMNWSNWS